MTSTRTEPTDPRHVRRQEARANRADPVLFPPAKGFYKRKPTPRSRRVGGYVFDYWNAEHRAVFRRATVAPTEIRIARGRRRARVARASRKANR